MPKTAPPLSEYQVAKATATDKPYKLFDGNRLYLLVVPTRKGTGDKLWRINYRYNRKQKTLALGVYPEVTLEDARKLRDDALLLLAEGIDPSDARKSAKAQDKARVASNDSLPSVRLVMGGGVEIWKGRAVVRLTSEEALFVREMMNKTT